MGMGDVGGSGTGIGHGTNVGAKNPLTGVRGLQQSVWVDQSDSQASASLELHNVLGSDFDFSTGLWVAAREQRGGSQRKNRNQREKHGRQT